MREKSQHGGTRKGAGRKPAPVRLTSFRISVDPQLHARYVSEAARRGVSVSSLYAEAARLFMAS